ESTMTLLARVEAWLAAQQLDPENVRNRRQALAHTLEGYPDLAKKVTARDKALVVQHFAPTNDTSQPPAVNRVPVPPPSLPNSRDRAFAEQTAPQLYGQAAVDAERCGGVEVWRALNDVARRKGF